MEEIDSLHPGDMARSILQVHFHHHLLPLKLAIFCNEKRHPVKLQPDIGYFTRPLAMDLNSFTKLENQLRGMFEYTRRFILHPFFVIKYYTLLMEEICWELL